MARSMIGLSGELERSAKIMSATTVPPRAASDWLYSPSFDRFFILGIPVLAIMAGSYVVARPDHFEIVLAINLWLLGYHHVIATFTRIAFDKQSLEENRFLVFGLPVLVFAGTLALAYGVGVWAVPTLYLYWQWFHYTRQSWGVSQVYRARAAEPPDDSPLFAKACLYLVPTWGILYRTWQAPTEFLGSEVWVPPTPGWLVTLVGAAAGASIVAWCVTRFQAWRAGRLAVAHSLYMVSHFVVFIVGYRSSTTSRTVGSSSTSGTTPSTCSSCGSSTPAASRGGSTRTHATSRRSVNRGTWRGTSSTASRSRRSCTERSSSSPSTEPSSVCRSWCCSIRP